MATITNKSQKPINLAGVVILPTQTAEVDDSALKLPTAKALIEKGFISEVAKKATAPKKTKKADENAAEVNE